NVPPDELYKDGLNRALFVPFIAMLNKRMNVVRLAARTDFRLEKLTGQPIWYVPDDPAADAALDQAWRRLWKRTGHTAERPLDSRTARLYGGGVIFIPRSVRTAACGRGLFAPRARISHHYSRSRSGNDL